MDPLKAVLHRESMVLTATALIMECGPMYQEGGSIVMDSNFFAHRFSSPSTIAKERIW